MSWRENLQNYICYNIGFILRLIYPVALRGLQQHCIWLRDPQDNPQAQWLIRRTQVLKSCCLMASVYYSERIQVKFSKGKQHMEPRLAETRYRFSGVLSLWGCTNVLNSLIRMCNNMHLALPMKEAHLRLWDRFLLGGQFRLQTCTAGTDVHHKSHC